MILLLAWTQVALVFLLLSFVPEQSQAQRQQQNNFLLPGHNLENFRILESEPVDSVVYQLRAIDRTNDKRKFSYHMTGDTFRVDEQTGEVRLIKPLDRERQAQIIVVISVFDTNDLKSDLPVESKRRTIFVEDVDDSWPIFTPNRHSLDPRSSRIQRFNLGKYVYHVNLSELAPINTVVLNELQVTDADEGLNAEIQLECRQNQSTNSACDVFSLDLQRHFNRVENSGKYSITIRTKQELDFETVESYKLTIVAKGKRASPKGVHLETEATILIDLINVQDEPPRFEDKPYFILMRESFQLGERLLTISAQDGDSEPKREISMIIAPGLFSEFFQISKDPSSSKVWFLETNTTIDRENPLISGSGDNKLTISVLAAELNEAGKPIASEDELFNALREPYYSSGTISKENITIIVLDLPDSKPLFYQASTGKAISSNFVVFNISESIQSGSAIPNLDLAVADLDQGVNSRFNLTLLDSKVGPPASEAFALENRVFYGRSTIVLKLLNSSLIDYEEPNLRMYKFYLVATKEAIDQPLSQILELQVNIVDSNDNSPKFAQDQYEIQVPENSLPGTVIATITAHDRDSGVFGRIDYMLRGQGASKFKLIANEGKIMVNDCGQLACLDHELQSTFSLIYEARDSGGKTEHVSVIINVLDLNDNSPNFTEQIYRRELISDNLSSNQNYISPQLIVRARDLDGPNQGNVSYKLKSSNLTGLDVDPVSGLVYLAQPIDLLQSMMTSAAPDRELVFEAEVLAKDNGTPEQRNSTARILLTVRDNRDGAPKFRQDSYQAYVKESQPIGKAFVQLHAIDPDDKDTQLRYSIAYDLNDLISIDSMSGELSFKTRVDYDDFKGSPYNVTIQATDNTKPQPLKGTTTVSIYIQDVNNKAPKFLQNQYKASIVEGLAKPGDPLLSVKAHDLDTNAQLNYSIVEDKTIVTDKNGQQLSVKDLINPSAAGYLSQLDQKERKNLVENLRRLFKVNAKTGLVELGAKPDYSFATAIKILIRVTDLNQELDLEQQQRQQQQQQQEDFVECQFFLQTHLIRAPTFAKPWSPERQEYNISIVEELSVGSVVFSLMATDPSTGKRVELFEKNPESDQNDFFTVTKAGLVLINKRIDFEELPQSSIVSLSAGFNKKRLSIQVKAIIHDLLSSVANLNFELIDLNDNAPEFDRQNYSATISESTVYPQEVLTVRAKDKDSKEFGQVYYSISGYSSHLYQIDPRRGVISVKKGAKLDRETDQENLFFVTASDCNTTAIATTTSENNNCKRTNVLVTISLLDENDNDPVFTNVNLRGEFDAVTSETVSVGSVIAQATAKDIDEGPNGSVSYEIVRNSENDLISRLLEIDRDGFIRVSGSLSGLGRSSPYRILIRASDQGNNSTTTSRQAHASLVLTINDVVSNDGVPKFLKPKPEEVIDLSENIGPSTFVYQVEAIDTDQESNGKIMYKFFKPSDTFEIDPFTGIIKTQNWPNFQLDREQVPNYTLIIVAQDLGSPPKQAFQTLPINVLDVNDNEPYFERNFDDPPIVIHVREEIPKNSLVGTIQAVDRDIGLNALIGYEIIDGNQNNMFRLDYGNFESLGTNNSTATELLGNNPCRIYSTERLDRETRESYTLTIRASSMSKLQTSFIRQFKDLITHQQQQQHNHHHHHHHQSSFASSESSSTTDQYNASDLTKIRVTIKLVDIDDNLPMFVNPNPKSVVDFSAEIYSELMQFKAIDLDSSNPDIQYSIVNATYFSDPRSGASAFNSQHAAATATAARPSGNNSGKNNNQNHVKTSNQQPFQQQQSILKAQIFEIDPRTGILWNLASLRHYIDGYFEIQVKAESGPKEAALAWKERASNGRRCSNESMANITSSNEIDCQSLQQERAAFAKAVLFVTQQKETFRLVFDKTKLDDRLDEFKAKVQTVLEGVLSGQQGAKVRAAASTSGEFASSLATTTNLGNNNNNQELNAPKAEKLFFNTFSMDFYEREDGSLDFSTLTSCTQLIRFDSKSAVPNQVMDYDEVVELLESLNTTTSFAQPAQQIRNGQQLQQQQSSGAQQKGSPVSLFGQYGLVKIERCLPERAYVRMSTSERISIWFAGSIAVVSLLLSLVAYKWLKYYHRQLDKLNKQRFYQHQQAARQGTMLYGMRY